MKRRVKMYKMITDRYFCLSNNFQRRRILAVVEMGRSCESLNKMNEEDCKDFVG